MNQEQRAASYDEFFLKPDNERIKIFNIISPENRAYLVKTHAERWLAANRSRLTQEQVALVEELIESVSSDWYKTDRELEVHPDAEVMVKKVEAVLSREDLRQLAANCADHIPPVNDGDG